MPSFQKRYETHQKRKAIKMLKLVIKMLESDDYNVQEFGMWSGLDGKQNCKVIVKENNFQTVLDDSG